MTNLEFAPEQVEKRRNETLRRMLSTPPQQHVKAPPETARSRKKADADEAPPALRKPEKA